MMTMKATKFFFDRKLVQDAVGRDAARAMSRFGAFVRTRGRSSIRRRKGISAPGSPPSAHSKDKVATIKNILFAWDPVLKGVLVGPVKLNMLTWVGGGFERGQAPPLLEFGGQAKIFERLAGDGKWYRVDLRRRRREGMVTRMRTANYRPRPFMGPALEKESAAGTMDRAWSASVRK